MLMQVFEKVPETRKTCELHLLNTLKTNEILRINGMQEPLSWLQLPAAGSWARGIQPTFTQATTFLHDPM
jgi:hypothetical protein